VKNLKIKLRKKLATISSKRINEGSWSGSSGSVPA
jgi:hypothetical protein